MGQKGQGRLAGSRELGQGDKETSIAKCKYQISKCKIGKRIGERIAKNKRRGSRIQGFQWPSKKNRYRKAQVASSHKLKKGAAVPPLWVLCNLHFCNFFNSMPFALCSMRSYFFDPPLSKNQAATGPSSCKRYSILHQK